MFFICMDSTSYVFSFLIYFFLPCVTTGWIFYIGYVRIHQFKIRNSLVFTRTNVLTFSPLTGGWSKDLDGFRFSFNRKISIMTVIMTVIPPLMHSLRSGL